MQFDWSKTVLAGRLGGYLPNPLRPLESAGLAASLDSVGWGASFACPLLTRQQYVHYRLRYLRSRRPTFYFLARSFVSLAKRRFRYLEHMAVTQRILLLIRELMPLSV